LAFASITGVEADAAGAAILTQDGVGFYAPHPAEAVRKALAVYAAVLSGREETQIALPSMLSNVLREPQSVSYSHLDLTKPKIELTEETTPVDAEGNIQLDKTHTRVRTLSYDQAAWCAEAEALKNHQLGQKIMENGVCTGIFLGVWEPKDRNGRSLGKQFMVIAAPEDLTGDSGKRTLLTFKNTAKFLTGKKNWHGYDGGSLTVLENDTALYQGLADGSAVGKWVFPTRDLLHGYDLDGNKVRDDNLYAHRNTGDFKNSFTTVDAGSGYAVWYWSCTEHRDLKSYVYNVRFSDGNGGWDVEDFHRLSCRPVRFETLTI
jgi:hypothetical protein